LQAAASACTFGARQPDKKAEQLALGPDRMSMRRAAGSITFSIGAICKRRSGPARRITDAHGAGFGALPEKPTDTGGGSK